jgi:hypothetical protein
MYAIVGTFFFSVVSPKTAGSGVSVCIISTFVTATSSTFGSSVGSGVCVAFGVAVFTIGLKVAVAVGAGLGVFVGTEVDVYTNIGVFTKSGSVETEIPGIRALHPSYSISKNDNFDDVLTISNNVLAGDLILVRTLGLNHKKVKQNYYVWSNGVENVIMTGLPSPVSLDEVKITKIILPATIIGASNSVFGSGIFTSNNITTNQPSNTERTLSVTLNGSHPSSLSRSLTLKWLDVPPSGILVPID